MGLFSTTLDSFETLLIDQLQDLYDAEQRLVKALPLMAEAAHHESLRSAFEQHLEETKNHVTRLQRAFQALGQKAKTKACQAMKGLIKEGDEVINADGDPDVKDAALIAAAQRVEHYEIAAYGCVRTFAERLGKHDIAQLLQETLDEEGAADKKLTHIAEQRINPQAAAV